MIHLWTWMSLGLLVCTFCKENFEILQCLFFNCNFSHNLWHWFYKTTRITIKPSHLVDIWSIWFGQTPQVTLVLKPTLIFLLNGIWYARNTYRYMNPLIPPNTIISSINAQVIIYVSHFSLIVHSFMDDFILLKVFDIRINYPKTHAIKKVI